MSEAPEDDPLPPSKSDVKKQPPGTIIESMLTPGKHQVSQPESGIKPCLPNTPCGSEHSKCTPTKRKREPIGASRHKTTLKKSPSKLYPSTSFISGDAAIRSGTEKPYAQESCSKKDLVRVKKTLNFSAEASPPDNMNFANEIKNETGEAINDHVGFSISHDDIWCHGKEEKYTAKEEDEPQGYESSRTIRDLIGKEIPEHIPEPAIVQVERNGLHKMVAFGVETTSLAWDCDIIQLTCSDLLHGRTNFCTYIMSSKPIQTQSSEVNGLTIVNGILKQNGNIVQTVSLEEGVLQFIEHLQENTILISHNTYCFQSHHLIRNILHEKKFLLERLQEKVIGFSDSYKIYLDLFPRYGPKELPSYKLWNLISYFSKGFKNPAFQKPAHGKDNLMKIRNLAELLRFHNLTDEKRLMMIYQFSMTFDSVVDVVKYRNTIKKNEKTFADMVQEKYLSKKMAQTMARSGLTLQHLRRAYEYGGLDCLIELLHPRITKNRKVIGKICAYCKKMI